MIDAAYHRAHVAGRSVGGIVLGTIGSIWGLLAAFAFDPPWRVVALALVVIVTVGLIVASQRTLQAAQRLPEPTLSDQQRQRLDRNQRMFWLIDIGQFVIIGIVIAVCNATGRGDLLLAAVVVVVGLHFWALVPFVGVRSDYIVGAVLCALALLAVLLVPYAATTGSRNVPLRDLLIAAGAALTLWITAAARIVRARALMQTPPASPTA